MDDFITLVRTVMRTFYEARSIVLMDYMVQFSAMKDDDIARLMRISFREAQKISAFMVSDRLLCKLVRAEPRPGDGRIVHRTYYYVDPKRFVQVVKLRMAYMRSSFNVRAGPGTGGSGGGGGGGPGAGGGDALGLECTVCLSIFSMLEATRFLDPQSGQFRCPHDGNELKKHVPKKDGAQEKLSLLNEQLSSLVVLLRRVDRVELPSHRPFEADEDAERQRIRAQMEGKGGRDDDMGELIDLSKKANTVVQHRITVKMETADAGADAAASGALGFIDARREVELREKEAKRQENLLPIWHQLSTVLPPMRSDHGGTGIGDAKSASAAGSSGVSTPRGSSAALDVNKLGDTDDDDDDDDDAAKPEAAKKAEDGSPNNDDDDQDFDDYYEQYAAGINKS